MKNGKILVYSRDQEMLDLIKTRVEIPGVLAITAMSAAEAQSLLESETFDAVVMADSGGRDDLLPLIAVAQKLDPLISRLSARVNEPLSRREYEILYTMLRGMGNREISLELGISEKTVKNHLWKIYRKFEVENRTQLFHQLLKSCPCMDFAPAVERIPSGSAAEESLV